jgi:hypothetical protein
MPECVGEQRNPFIDLNVRAHPSAAYVADLGRDWSDTELRLHDYSTAATVRGWLIGAMIAQFRRIKRFIKQSPGLWRSFSKARALARSLTASRP